MINVMILSERPTYKILHFGASTKIYRIILDRKKLINRIFRTVLKIYSAQQFVKNLR